MTDYQIKPFREGHPSPQTLADDLERAGWKVEMTVTGPPDAWESLRFVRPAPPEEVECFVLFDRESGTYAVSLPATAGDGAHELQFRVVDALQKTTPCKVIDPTLGRGLTQAELRDWASRYRPFDFLRGSRREVFWRFFPLLVAAVAVYVALHGPGDRRMIAWILAALSILAGLGLLWKSNRA
jgi:hypothetical protein